MAGGLTDVGDAVKVVVVAAFASVTVSGDDFEAASPESPPYVATTG
jgi:hypothetical protein